MDRREPFDLAGWEEYSVWGWDDGIGSYFAQLYRNDDPAAGDEEPTIWLSGINPRYPSEEALAGAIAQAVKQPITAVRRAMVTL